MPKASDFVIIKFKSLNPFAVFRYKNNWWVKTAGQSAYRLYKFINPIKRRYKMKDLDPDSRKIISNEAYVASNNYENLPK